MLLKTKLELSKAPEMDENSVENEQGIYKNVIQKIRCENL